MSIRSDVAVALTKELDQKVREAASEKVLSMLDNDTDYVEETDDQKLYVFNSVKWYIEDGRYDCGEFYHLIGELTDEDDDWYMVEVCSENMSVETYGYMIENDFNIGYNMELCYA